MKQEEVNESLVKKFEELKKKYVKTASIDKIISSMKKDIEDLKKEGVKRNADSMMVNDKLAKISVNVLKVSTDLNTENVLQDEEKAESPENFLKLIVSEGKILLTKVTEAEVEDIICSGDQVPFAFEFSLSYDEKKVYLVKHRYDGETDLREYFEGLKNKCKIETRTFASIRDMENLCEFIVSDEQLIIMNRDVTDENCVEGEIMFIRKGDKYTMIKISKQDEQSSKKIILPLKERKDSVEKVIQYVDTTAKYVPYNVS
jgi:hypothetical protein